MSDLPATIGRYHIVKRLGRGGMGVVYLARDPLIGRDVAIKVLRTLDESDLRARFAREIQIAGALAHPNIVRIYDAGEFDDQPFVAMEYVSGPTLDHYIKSGTPVSVDRKLELLIDLADGLAHAHARDVVHRDIKPSNLIIDDHNRLKILDFGIARFAASGNVSLVAVGTPSYMAPEQIRGEPVDARCDVFAAGVVAYELLAYRRPFVGESHHIVHQRILTDAPAPLQAHDARLPRVVADIVEVALQKRPQDRFPSAKAMGDALRLARTNLSVEESTVVTAYSPPGAAAADSSAPPATSPSPVPSASSPRPGGKMSKRVAEVRERLLETAKDAARTALAEGRIDAAVQAAEQALAVDGTDAEAAELLEQARLAADHNEAQALVAQARTQMAAGALVSAKQALDSARALWPDSSEIEELQRRIARQIREREEQVLRAREVAAAVARARVALESGDLVRAQATIREALARDATHPEALEVQDLVQARVEESAARARREAEAEAACRTAEEEFARGAQLDAIHRLETQAPAHPRVTSLLADLRARRRTALDEQRRLATNAKRQRQIEQVVDTARAALEARDVPAALAALGTLDDEARATELVRRIAAEANALQAAIAREADDRRRAALAAATAALDSGDAQGARRLLQEMVAGGLGGTDVDAAMSAVARAEEAAQRRQQRELDLQAGLGRVHAAVAARDLSRALTGLRRLTDGGFTQGELAPAASAIAALQQELAAERAREQARAQAVAAVERALDDRDPAAARQRLERVREGGAPDALVASLESRCADLEGALQAERDREQQQRAGRSALDAALDRRDEAAARRALDALAGAETAAAHADLARRVESLARALAAERDLAQRVHSARLAVTEALDARNPGAARAALDTLRALGPGDVHVRDLDKQLTDLEEELTAEAEAIRWRADQLAVVGRALDERRVDDALAALSALHERGARGRDIDACAARAAALRSEIAAAREREERLEATLADFTVAVQQEDLSGARRLLRTLESEGAAASALDPARTEVAALASAIDQRERHEADLRRGLSDVDRALAVKQADAARSILTALRAAGFTAAELQGAESRLAAVDEELRVAREAEAARAKEQERERARAAEHAAQKAREAEAARAKEQERERARAAEQAAQKAREAEAARAKEQERERARAAAEQAAQKAREAEAARAREAERRHDETLLQGTQRPPAAGHETEIPDVAATLLAHARVDETLAVASSVQTRPAAEVVPRPRRSPVAVGVLIAAALVVIVGGWAVMRSGSPKAGPDAPPIVEPTPPDVGLDIAALRESAVAEALAAARRDAESGQLDDAIARLQRFEPADPRVDGLRGDLEALRTENRASTDARSFAARLDAALRDRDYTTASSVASEAMKKYPTAPAVVDGVRRLARAAGQEAETAKRAANAQRDSALYRQGVSNESQAARRVTAEPLEAFRQYRTATDAFARAARQSGPRANGAEDIGADTAPTPTQPGHAEARPAENPPPPVPPEAGTKDSAPAKVPGAGESGGSSTPTGPGEARGGTTPPTLGSVPDASANRAAAMNTARTEILQLVRAFEAAYGAMDETRLRELQPGFTGIPGKPLLKSVRLTISDVQIRLADDLASANVVGTSNYQYEWRRSGFPSTSPAPLNWTVVKTDRGWRVR